MIIFRLLGRLIAAIFRAIFRLNLGLLVRLLVVVWPIFWTISFLGGNWIFGSIPPADINWPEDNAEVVGPILGALLMMYVLGWMPIQTLWNKGTTDRWIGIGIPASLLTLLAIAYVSAIRAGEFPAVSAYLDEYGGFYRWYFGVLFGGLALIFCGLVLPAMLGETAAFRAWFRHGQGGSARWAGPLTFQRLKFNKKGTAPIYLGRTLHKYDPWLLCRHIGVDDESHMVTIAQSRSGKSTTAIWPNLVQYAYPDSVFVLDPKGEHARHTAHRRPGRSVILDPFNETGGLHRTGFNPLAEIDPRSPRAKEDISSFADACVIGTTTSDTGAHFVNLQRAMITGIIAHVLTTQPRENHHLPAVYDLFLSMSDPEKFAGFLNEMRNNKACGNAPQEAVLMYDQAGKNEKGSIFTTTLSNISWIASDGMRQHLMEGGLSLSSLRTEVLSVYVVLDFDAMKPEKQGRYMRVLINMALDKCRTTPLPRERSHRRTLFILDEVAQLGAMPSIDNAYRTLAGSHIKIWSFFQNWEGLKATTSGPNALMGNATKQFFGCGDPETAQEIEKYLGRYMHSSGDHERSRGLLDATEIMDLLGQQKMVQIAVTATGETLELKRLPFVPKRSTYVESDQSTEPVQVTETVVVPAPQAVPPPAPAPVPKPVEAAPPPVAPANTNTAELLNEDEASALKRFRLVQPFTMEELDDKLMFWLGRVPPSKVDQVNADYEVLQAIAEN